MHETGLEVVTGFSKGLFWNQETLEYCVLNEVNTTLRNAISAFGVSGTSHISLSSGTH
ncbi:MAG: hypothetical protein U0Z75_07305 [Deinococcaceae bacterium]